MRLIFSKDRPAQLDLLLRSLERYAPEEETRVICHTITESYREVLLDYPDMYLSADDGIWFDDLLRGALRESGPIVTFFCDDDVVFREWPWDPREALQNPDVLTFSLRLASRAGTWRWTAYPPTDHGYPGSIDGHLFRIADVQEMLGPQPVENPTMLETRLARRCDLFKHRRPLMASFGAQVLVGVDVNRVSEQTGVTRRATRYPQPVDELAQLFDAGLRIDLDALDFSGVNGCHVELPFVWSDRAAVT